MFSNVAVFVQDANYREFWVDFSVGSKCVSILCDSCTLANNTEGNVWEVVSIPCTSVKRASLDRGSVRLTLWLLRFLASCQTLVSEVFPVSINILKFCPEHIVRLITTPLSDSFKFVRILRSFAEVMFLHFLWETVFAVNINNPLCFIYVLLYL